MKLRCFILFFILAEARKPRRGKSNRGNRRGNEKIYPKSCHDIYVQAGVSNGIRNDLKKVFWIIPSGTLIPARSKCEDLPGSGFHTIRVKFNVTSRHFETVFYGRLKDLLKIFRDFSQFFQNLTHMLGIHLGFWLRIKTAIWGLNLSI